MPRRVRASERAAEWRKAISGLRTWQRGGQRAVHKPLLTLLLIARAERGAGARVSFAEISKPLLELLREFGRPRQSYHPEYPFWHLQSDGFWVAEGDGPLPLRKSGNSPSKKTLLERNAIGTVPAGLWAALCLDRELRAELATALLHDYWPASYHESIRAAAGLTSLTRERRIQTRAIRDPAFREAVLRAYERRCAVCGFDARLGKEDLALEAAHIRWHCYAGPDELANGLALCTMHHTALDRGAIGLTHDSRILVSADVHGAEMVETLLLRFAGKRLRPPQSGMEKPAAAHIQWHSRQVFRAPARRPA